MTLKRIVFLIVGFLFAFESKGQCGTAYVSSDDTVVCVPKIVRFKVHKFPAGTTFEWDLGSGYVSSDSTYTKLYATSGNYNVRVKLRYLDGSTCIIDKVGFIQAKPVPIPAYSISKQVICGYNDSVTLTDMSPKTVSRDWLVDNVLYTNGPKVLKTIFRAPNGYKSFTMFMRDSFGCEGKKTFDDAVFIPDSISVNFSANKLSGCTPAFVNFKNLTDTLGQAVQSWNWSFVGASPSSSNQYEPKNIQYNVKDTFDIMLTMVTKRGCTYSKRRDAYMMFADSILLSASFNKVNLCGNESLKVTLNNARSATPSVVTTPSTSVSSKIANNIFAFKFTNFGTYSFLVTDEINGCKSEKWYNNHVTINGPIGGFMIPDNISCLRPDTFSAIDTSKLELGVSKTLKWDLFYDTVLTLDNSIQTSTSSPGELICDQYHKYTVRMVITGNNGCRDTVIKKTAITIQKILPRFSWTPKPACPAEVVQFANNTPRGTSKAENRYRWTFYNNLNNGVLARDTVQNPKLSYPDTGHYTVKLLAFNNLGCRDSLTLEREVLIERPIPKFFISDSNACFRTYVGLKAIYKDSGYYTTYNHKWIFQHVDSSYVKSFFNGDSATVALLPGTYIIKYTRFSKRNTCFDSITLPFRLKVSGINYLVSTDPVKVCNPFNAKLVAKPTFDYNYKNGNSTPYTYNWSHFYDTAKVAIRQPNINPSTVYIKKSGYFYFKFKYTHPSGCNDSVNTTTLTSGVVAAIYPERGSAYACVDRPLFISNRSDKDAVKFKWFMKDSGSGAKFLPTDTSKDVSIVFKNEGAYKMGLIAYGSGDCTDTLIATLYSNDIRARFTSSDTLNYCAPIIARVTAERHPFIYQYRWYLGDGDSVTNNLSTFGHLYKQNTGPDGSDVKLIVYGYGCNDTMDKKGFIKVIGPIPKFELSNNIGCEKLHVNFINQSKYYRRFFLEYGDGSVLDSVNFNKHTYRIFDRSLPYQKFKPTLSVIDSFGCLVQYEKDTVFVLKSPEPNFRVNNDTGCADFTVNFTNLTIGGVGYQWDFDNDGVIDNQTFSPKFTYPPGEFNPTLIARASNGCRDTVKNVVAIKAHQRPEVRFTPSQDTICYNGRINFAANSVPSNADIKRWEWNFGDPASLTDTAYTQNPSYNFKKLYLSQIVLLVTDKNNCTDTFDRFIYTNDTFGPPSKQINYVTIAGTNQFVDVNWSKSDFKAFKGYSLFNDAPPNYNLVYSTGLRNDTTYRINSGINLNTNRYCYVLKTQDKCNNLGPITYPHCTIFLQVTDTAVSDLILDWLPYEGWGVGGVRRYRIYRSEAGGPFKLIDSVVNSENTYRDRKLCNKTYCYYVEALDVTGKWVSRSNSVCKSALYIPPSVPVNSIRTTVLPNNTTYTQWNPYTYAKYVDHYIISRSAPIIGTDDFYANSDTVGFIDVDKFLETNRSSYTYTIRAVDHCGNESPKGDINKTILLGGKSEGYIAKLNWSAYQKWNSGVRQYEILVRENNSFVVKGTINNAAADYSFDFEDTNLDDSICFKIRAIKDTSILVESFSNVLCLISDAKIFVPDAFSPNKDDKNEVFIPKAILIFNQTGNPILDYKLEIYNRWGEQVFVSDDVNVGWDGTYKGEICPEGHYVYKVRALALDGVTSFNLEGVFVLLR